MSSALARTVKVNGAQTRLSLRFGDQWFGHFLVPELVGPRCLIAISGEFYDTWHNDNRPRVGRERVWTPLGPAAHSFPASWITPSQQPAIFEPA